MPKPNRAAMAKVFSFFPFFFYFAHWNRLHSQLHGEKSYPRPARRAPTAVLKSPRMFSGNREKIPSSAFSSKYESPGG